MKYLLLFSLLCLFSFHSRAQVPPGMLPEAVRWYYQRAHFPYDPVLIREKNIATIEKVEFYSKEDSLNGGRLIEKHLFREDGLPVRVEYSERSRADFVSIEFQYDSLNNLVQKTITKPSTTYPFKPIETERFQWEYRETALTGMYQYGILGDGNEQPVLYAYDSIAYNANNSITVFSNYPAKRKKAAVGYHLPSFNHPTQVVLTLHTNGFLQSKTVLQDSATETIYYGNCGYARNTLAALEIESFTYGLCLPPELRWMSEAETDSMVYENSLREIYLKRETFWPHSAFFPELDQNTMIRIDYKTRLLTVQTVREDMAIRQAGNDHAYIREVKQYDPLLRLMQTERFSAHYRDAFYKNNHAKIDPVKPDKLFPRHLTETYEKEVYEYYDNTIMMKISTLVNGQNETIRRVLIKLSHF